MNLVVKLVISLVIAAIAAAGSIALQVSGTGLYIAFAIATLATTLLVSSRGASAEGVTAASRASTGNRTQAHCDRGSAIARALSAGRSVCAGQPTRPPTGALLPLPAANRAGSNGSTCPRDSASSPRMTGKRFLSISARYAAGGDAACATGSGYHSSWPRATRGPRQRMSRVSTDSPPIDSQAGNRH